MDAAGCTAKIITLNPHLLNDVLDNIRQLGDAVGAQRIAESLIDSLLLRTTAVRSAMARVDRPRVLTIEWIDPIMPGGHWVPEIVEIAGGTSQPIAPGQPSSKVPWEDLRELRPEVVVLMPCGFGPERAAMEAEVLWSLPGWALLPAVQKGRVFVVDGNAHFSRPGPRLIDGLEILAHILHPARWRRPAFGSVFKLVSPPAGASSVENWAPRFEQLL